MNQSLANKLVLCDLDNLLLGPDGNLTQVVRDVLQLFSSRGGRFTVFSQRTPKAVRAILGSVRLSAPALVCGGTLAYHFADGSRQPLCSFAGQDAGLFASLPSAAGVGIALQMQDGSTRVLRMSHALEQHLQQEWTPYLLANAADIRPDEVLRALVYQDNRSIPLTSLLEKALGDSTTALLGEPAAPDSPDGFGCGDAAGRVHAGGHCPGKCAGAGGQYAHAGAGAGRKLERCGGRCPGGAAPCRKAGHPDRCCRRRCRGGFVPHGAGC